MLELQAQCPPNLDFEFGNFNNWVAKTGKYTGGNITNLVTGVSAGRHTIINASSKEPLNPTSDKDFFGDFPLLCPNGSKQSVKLGSVEINYIARTLSYTIKIPANANNYSITYWYAVVFQDPGHPVQDQPKFTAKLLDKNNIALNCASYTYVATSNLPGFQLSPKKYKGVSVYYKGWTPVTFDLSGRGGQTVTLEFTAEDCGQGGHFGYAYIDVNSSCGSAVSGTYCAGAKDLQLNGPSGFQQYTWTDLKTNQVVGSSQNLILSPVPPIGTTMKLDLVPYPGFGCPYSLLTPIVPTSLPTVTANGDKLICLGGSADISFNFTGSPPWNMQYTDGTVTQQITINSSPFVLNVQPGTSTKYTVLSVSDASCTNSNPNAVANITVVNNAALFQVSGGGNDCMNGIGKPINLSGSQIGFSYQLFLDGIPTGNPLLGTGTSLSFGNQKKAGIYSVQASISSNGSCNTAMTGSAIISINPIPSPFTITGGGRFCMGDVGLEIGTNGSNLNTNYILYRDNQPISDSLPGTGTAISFGKQLIEGSYRIISFDNNGCQLIVQDSVNIVVDSLPKAFEVVGGGGFCSGGAGLPITLSGSVTGYQYQLFLDGKPLDNPYQGNGDSIHFGNRNIAGNYTVIGANNSNTGCKLNMLQTAIVSIFQNPNLQIQSNAGTCQGNQLELQGTGASIYQWANADSLSKIVIRPTKDTVLQLKGIDANGCVATTSKAIQVYATPTVAIFPRKDARICQGDSLSFSSLANAGSGSIQQYQWYHNGNKLGTDSAIVTKLSGAYSLEIINSFGCVNRSPESNVSLIPQPTGIIETPTLSTICENGYNTIAATTGLTGYQWLLNGKAIPGANSYLLRATQEGKYTVLLKNEICVQPASNTIDLTLLKRPLVKFAAAGFCIDQVASFTNQTDTSKTGPIQWQWQFGDGTTANSYQANNIYRKPGKYNAILTAIPSACIDLTSSSSAFVQIDAPVKATRYASMNAVTNTAIPLTARSFGKTYAWSPSTGISNSNNRTVYYNGNKETDYLVKITTASGCVTIDSILVRVFKTGDIFVAKAFTPNADGVNEKIYPLTVGIKQFLYLRIYNRWGQLMFETTSISNGWDGTSNGKKQPMDTYTWIVQGITEDDRVIQKTGNTLLIR
jgi:gliding motility-associated-like protein